MGTTTALLAALLLAGSGDAAERYGREVCPVPRVSGPHQAQKRALAQRAECARRAESREVERAARALGKEGAALRAEQPAFDAWVEQSCDLAERLFWIDLDTGLRGDGTARDETRLRCEAALRFERAVLADELRGKAAQLSRKRVEGELRGSTEQVQELARLSEALAARAARPAPAAMPGGVETPLAPSDWQALQALAASVQSGAASIARQSCAHFAAWEGCDDALRDALLARAAPSRHAVDRAP